MKEFVKSHKQITGIIGHPIKHTLSPLMHNLAFELTGLDYIYLSFDVPTESLSDALKGMAALGIKGFNVTLPHKERIIPLLNKISEEASSIGAVNTVLNENGLLTGYNTDVYGIIQTFEPFRDEIADSEITVIGAGGAVRSLLYALVRNFKAGRINLVNRTAEKAELLKDYYAEKILFEKIFAYELVPPDLKEVFRRSKVIVNATPVGMFPHTDDSPLALSEFFREGQIVFDLIYNPLETKFLKLASDAGARTVNGLKMFIHQGAKAFELWTGKEMPVEKIYPQLQSELQKEK
jgi:shikimate dehydrogenase